MDDETVTVYRFYEWVGDLRLDVTEARKTDKLYILKDRLWAWKHSTRVRHDEASESFEEAREEYRHILEHRIESLVTRLEHSRACLERLDKWEVDNE